MKSVSNKEREAKNPTSRLRRKGYYSINELAESFDVNVWTIRLWVNRFDILEPRLDKKGNLLFTPEDAERIGTIYNLSKKRGTTLYHVRKHLESGTGVV